MSNFFVKRFPRLRRAFRVATVSAFSSLAFLVVLVHVQQRVLRHRAEQLCSDIRKVELRKSTWGNAQEIFSRWGARGRYDGECVEQRCIYQIELDDFLTTLAYQHPKIAEHLSWVETPYEMLGGRPTRIMASLSVLDGAIWGKDFVVSVAVPPERGTDVFFGGEGYALVGVAHSVSRFFDGHEVLPMHPNYKVGRPGGCNRCVMVYAEFTPYADPRDVHRLMDFDLSCITRWRPCREQGEIMPTAWKEYTAEESSREAVWKQRRECNYPLELMGRDSENAVVVDVIANRLESNSGGPRHLSTVRLVKRLKDASFWEMNTIQEVPVRDSSVNHTTHNQVQDVSPGRRFILLFTHGWWANVGVEECGAIPFTEENLFRVQRGIDQDYASRLP